MGIGHSPRAGISTDPEHGPSQGDRALASLTNGERTNDPFDTNQPRDFMGLFVPATWELAGTGEDPPPPLPLINGSTDEKPERNSNGDKEIG